MRTVSQEQIVTEAAVKIRREAQEGGCSRFLEDSFVWDFSTDHSATSQAHVPSVLQQQTRQVLKSKMGSKSSAVF